jgi:hypothetical protein
MDAVEPGGVGAADTVEEEPYCLLCRAPVGIFQAHGPDYRHYKAVLTATSKPKRRKATTSPVIGWRAARETAVC